MDKYRYTYPIEMQSTLSELLKGKERKGNEMEQASKSLVSKS